MATLLKVLNNLADIKSAGGVALRVRTQGLHFSHRCLPSTDGPAAVRRTVRACQERDAVAGWVLTGSNQADVG
jgi:hypothetical protein